MESGHSTDVEFRFPFKQTLFWDHFGIILGLLCVNSEITLGPMSVVSQTFKELFVFFGGGGMGGREHAGIGLLGCFYFGSVGLVQRAMRLVVPNEFVVVYILLLALSCP